MEDEGSVPLDGKNVGNLRVVDLKLELEKRGLSKSGSKKDLVKRLKQQLEFEKLCEERKSTGDCDLKLELDAATEQNEFVQQYLAQQQKIYAEQKEAKRRIELEEIQKSSDEQESYDSSSATDESRVKSTVRLKVSEDCETDDNDSRAEFSIKTTENKSSDVKDSEAISTDSLDKNCSSEITEKEISLSESSAPESSVVESSSTVSSCLKEQLNMEPSTQFSTVPYSLSDIQLPESPAKDIVSSKVSKNDSNETCPVEKVTDDKHEMTTNGISPADVPLPEEDHSSTSEKLESQDTGSVKDEPVEKTEPVKNDSKKKTEDSENDSNEETDHKNTKIDKKDDFVKENDDDMSPNTETKSNSDVLKKNHQKIQSQSHKSDNERSSDSDNSHKSNEIPSKRARRKHSRSESSSESRSRSSSSSSTSSSSSNSPDRDSSKKRSRTKHTVSSKSEHLHSEEVKSSECEINVESKEKESNSVRTKQRLKIKRDNVTKSSLITSVNSSVPKETNLSSKNESAIEPVPSSPTVDSKKTEVKVEKPLEVTYTSRKVSLSNRKLSRHSVDEKADEEPKPKRSKWSSFANAQKSSQTVSISTDALKNWFPDFKLVTEAPPASELMTDDSIQSSREEHSAKVTLLEEAEMEEQTSKHVAHSQKDAFDEPVQPASPMAVEIEEGPVSKILFIQNLVRPFTLNQLKDLLKQSGEIVEEQFWIDKIKSKCFVTYENEESAVKAKNALNGCRWPSSNPKILSVEYSTEDDLDFHKKNSEQPKIVPEPKPAKSPDAYEVRTVVPVEEHRKREREHRREREKARAQVPVREWDQDKISQDSPEKEYVSKDSEKTKSDKRDKKEAKRKSEEDTPAKLLDDLFRKTKSSPCIYWLPLTEEQVREREEALRLRRQEREKRNQLVKEQEETERRNKKSRSDHRSRERENRKSASRSRSPVSRRR